MSALTLIEQTGRIARFSVTFSKAGAIHEWFLVCYVGAFPRVTYFGEDRQRSMLLYQVEIAQENK